MACSATIFVSRNREIISPGTLQKGARDIGPDRVPCGDSLLKACSPRNGVMSVDAIGGSDLASISDQASTCCISSISTGLGRADSSRSSSSAKYTKGESRTHLFVDILYHLGKVGLKVTSAASHD